MTLDFEKYEQALRHLELQYNNYVGAAERPELTKLDKEALAESVIQRFETCYDTAWKHLKKHLILVMGVPEAPNSPKPIFRIADTNNLLGDGLNRWLAYAVARVNISDDYSGEKAQECLAVVPSFISDAIALYETLTGTKWQPSLL